MAKTHTHTHTHTQHLIYATNVYWYCSLQFSKGVTQSQFQSAIDRAAGWGCVNQLPLWGRVLPKAAIPLIFLPTPQTWFTVGACVCVWVCVCGCARVLPPSLSLSLSLSLSIASSPPSISITPCLSFCIPRAFSQSLTRGSHLFGYSLDRKRRH